MFTSDCFIVKIRLGVIGVFLTGFGADWGRVHSNLETQRDDWRDDWLLDEYETI